MRTIALSISAVFMLAVAGAFAWVIANRRVCARVEKTPGRPQVLS